jgi:hypothetical protein
MNKSLVWWIGLILFVFGAFGAIVPPENYPGWYARAWGITHPYTTDSVGSSAGVNAQIWTGRGVKGVGGDTRLELNQPALRQEASDADSRVDGRAQHRTWMLFVAIVGLFLMILDWMRSDRESDDRRLRRLEAGRSTDRPTTTTDQPAQTTAGPFNPFTDTEVKPNAAPLSSSAVDQSLEMNDDPEPTWWQRLWAPLRRSSNERPRPASIATAPLEPIKINVVVESEGGEGKVKAKHTLTAELPPMTVHAVTAHLKVGTNDTVQQMDLDVH